MASWRMTAFRSNQVPSPTQLRWSAALRVCIAVIVSAALTALAIALLSRPLELKTDILGYPVFADFNVQNYFTAYYLVVGFFPVAALLLFAGLTRLGPRIGLAVPPARGGIRPHTRAPGGEELDPDPAPADHQVERGWASRAGRTGFVAAVLGLEIGIVLDAIAAGLLIGVIAYPLAGALACRVERFWRRDSSFDERLAAVNAVSAPLAVAGLSAVSSVTEVTILSDGTSDPRPWFPLWLALPIGAAILAVVVAALRRSTSLADLLRIERRALLLIAAPVGLFLLLAWLPGELGQIDMFHTGEGVAATRLVGDGWFPWRDVVLTHGLLTNVVGPGVSFGVFENSIWGSYAGSTFLLLPLYFVSLYYLFAYLFGRNWLFLLFAVLLVLGTSLAPGHFRVILWPLVLLLLASALNRPTVPRTSALALLTVTQVVLTPEAAPALPAVAVTLALYEWYWSRPGAGFPGNFRRTILFTGTSIGLLAGFAAYLAIEGALDDAVYITATFVRGHALTGGLPPSLEEASPLYVFMALAPPAAILISFAYAAARLRLRRPVRIEDWVMAAAVLFTVAYYAKFLARMSSSHAAQPYAAALPLVLFIVYKVVTASEGWIRERLPGTLLFRATTHPVSLALVALVVVLGWAHLDGRISRAASNYRPEVQARPQFERVGYAVDPFDPVMYRDLSRVIDGYLDPDDRLFDFTNAPALYFYLLDRYPSTRYFHASLALRAKTQADLIERLRRARPKLIVFDTFLVGLPNWDGIPNAVRSYNVSRWILDHYRPLLTTHTTTFFARRDQPPLPDRLELAETPLTERIEFLMGPCTWGYAPSFLDGAAQPGPGSASVSAAVVRLERPRAAVIGWAADTQAEASAREVIATVDGRVVGRATPRVERYDLILGGLPEGFGASGFRLPVPAAVAKSGDLRVFGIARDGSVAELPPAGSAPPRGRVRLGGRTVRLEPTAVSGQIDSTLQTPSMQVERPAGSSWADYRWLEIVAGKNGFGKGELALFDRLGSPVPGSREITFKTLERSPRRYVVQVSSCPQWHGYQARRLFFDLPPGQKIAGVRLIR